MNLGGAERQLLLLCKELQVVIDLDIITLDSSGPLLEKYKEVFPNLKVFDSSKDSFLILLKKLITEIRTQKPNLVITWLYKADILGGIAAKLAGRLPVIWSARNSDLPSFSYAKRVLMGMFSRAIPSAVVANGEPAINFHESIGYPARKITLIPNLLAPWTMSFRSNSRLLNSEKWDRPLRVGIAARQVSGKGILETIHALDGLDASIVLTIIGQETPESSNWKLSGSYRDYIVNEIKDENQLAEWFRELDVYLMASTHWESQPNSLLEAMAIGCPVLVSDVIDLGEMVSKECLFSFKNSGALVQSLDLLASLETQKVTNLVIQQQQKVYKEFSTNAVISQWELLINKFSFNLYK
jgi:glycosyltransferase involved in cell wall biosynthesis